MAEDFPPILLGRLLEVDLKMPNNKFFKEGYKIYKRCFQYSYPLKLSDTKKSTIAVILPLHLYPANGGTASGSRW